MLDNNPRNPILVFVFAIVGAAIRFAFFYSLAFLRGSIYPKFSTYSTGFRQIVYNLLLVVFLIIGFILWMIFSMVQE